MFCCRYSSTSATLPVLKAALCVFRQAFVARPMNDIERDYFKLQEQLELENSYLSDHELRLQREKLVMDNVKSSTLLQNMTETGMDYELKRMEKLKAILASRPIDESDKLESVLRQDSKKLMMFIASKDGEVELPVIELQNEELFRDAIRRLIDRTLSGLHGGIHLLGNCPSAVLKTTDCWAFLEDAHSNAKVKGFSWLRKDEIKMWKTHPEALSILSSIFIDL